MISDDSLASVLGISGLRLDEIGIWSEVKLDIVKGYAGSYSTILAAQPSPGFHHSYIDAFAGAGVHISKTSKTFVRGSPTNALLVKPPFKRYYFIDLDDPKCALLRQIAGNRSDVVVEGGDCNEVLLQKVLPQIRYADRHRALCVLDPYGLHVKWTTIMAIARTKAIEISRDVGCSAGPMMRCHYECRNSRTSRSPNCAHWRPDFSRFSGIFEPFLASIKGKFGKILNCRFDGAILDGRTCPT